MYVCKQIPSPFITNNRVCHGAAHRRACTPPQLPVRAGVDCPQSLVMLYQDCTALEAEQRPTASQLYSRLHAIVFGEEELPKDAGMQGSVRDHAGVPGPAGSHMSAALSGLSETAAPFSTATTAFFADDDSDAEV